MKYQYWLARNLTNAKIHRFLKKQIPADEVWGMSEKSMVQVAGLKPEEAEKIEASRRRWDLQVEWERFLEKGISFITQEQEDYPEKLRQIYNAPYALYYIGRLPDRDAKQVAIVGARGRSAYGSSVARDLSKALAERNIDIISGMALGIDTDGHMGALEGKGRTYAVLGCGPDVVYPKQNTFLYEKIRMCGGIISEYPPGTQPIARNFPARNRIISGLSDKVVVVEAKEKSGSLITADFAMEQGKDVYAVPGRITDPLSRGCNELIRQGAGIFTGTADFLKDLELDTGTICTQTDFIREILEPQESLVYGLMDYKPLAVGTMMDRLSLSLTDLLPVLEELKKKGLIRECFPNYFVRAGLE